jgi:hypothetical protein
MSTLINTTYRDLHVTAFAAANANLTADALTQETARIAAFQAAGFDAADYSDFEAIHRSYIANLTQYARTPTKAAVAAQNAAKAAAATK